nr:hypothetical protein [Tanacetum cinerariifolium]
MNKEVDNVVPRLDLTGSSHGRRLEKLPNYVDTVSLVARKQLWAMETVILCRASRDVVMQDLLTDALSTRRVIEAPPSKSMSTNEADDEIRAKLLRIGCYFDCDEEDAAEDDEESEKSKSEVLQRSFSMQMITFEDGM